MLTITKIIRDQLIPSIKRYGMNKVVTPARDWEHLSAGQPAPIRLSSHVLAVPKQLRGPRLVRKNPRLYGNLSPLMGLWRHDRLTEWRVPSVVFVTSGQADIRIHDYILRCDSGHAILMPVGTPHSDCTRGHAGVIENVGDMKNTQAGRNCELLWLAPQMMAHSMMGIWQCFTLEGLHSDYDREGRHFEEHVVPSSRAVSYFLSLNEEAEEKKEGWEDVCQGLMLAFLRCMQRELERNNFVDQSYPFEQGDARAADTDPISSACEYIQARLDQRLTIEQVSHAVFMSRSLFIRRFAQSTGQTFNQYLNQQRLQRAKRLLQSTDWTVTYISSHVGIRPDRLRVLFRKHLDTTPNDYRATLRTQKTSMYDEDNRQQ